MGKLWGGRFESDQMDNQVLEFSSSLDVDRALAKYDCLSTRVHVEMLARKNYISAEEKKDLEQILDELSREIDEGVWSCEGHEDIHSAIQDYVEKRSPDASKKMHTGRSRNEQVVNDARLYCKESIDSVCSFIMDLQEGLVALAGRTLDVIIPGYTHLNRAQPVLFSHLMMAYVEMLQRDIERLEDAGKRCDISVMGSGALAGSALELDRKFVAEKLGFAEVSPNSIDSVSDRDFIAEMICCLSFVAVHLSRMSEDLILYSTPEFGFLEMGAEYCTGSSLMPQKKNPDVLELVRGRAASVISNLNCIFVLLKGLPHSYNRDLQEDKRPLFDSVEVVSSELGIMAELVSTIQLNREAAAKALESEYIYATDLAEYLVRKGVPFSEAHQIIGGIVKHCGQKDINISDLSISELRGFSEELEEDVYGLLNPETSVKNKKTPGSTNPEFVRKQITKWKKRLEP